MLLIWHETILYWVVSVVFPNLTIILNFESSVMMAGWLWWLDGYDGWMAMMAYFLIIFLCWITLLWSLLFIRIHFYLLTLTFDIAIPHKIHLPFVVNRLNTASLFVKREKFCELVNSLLICKTWLPSAGFKPQNSRAVE